MEKLRFALQLTGINLFALISYLVLSVPINYKMPEAQVMVENFPNDFAIGLPQIYYQFADFHGSYATIFYNVAISGLGVLIFIFAWWLKTIPEESEWEKQLVKRLKKKMKWQLCLVGVVFGLLTLQLFFVGGNLPLYFSLLFILIVHIVLYKQQAYIEHKSVELSEKEEEDDIY